MENPRTIRSQEDSARQSIIGLDSHFPWMRPSSMLLTLHSREKRGV